MVFSTDYNCGQNLKFLSIISLPSHFDLIQNPPPPPQYTHTYTQMIKWPTSLVKDVYAISCCCFFVVVCLKRQRNYFPVKNFPSHMPSLMTWPLEAKEPPTMLVKNTGNAGRITPMQQNQQCGLCPTDTTIVAFCYYYYNYTSGFCSLTTIQVALFQGTYFKFIDFCE